MEQIILWTVGIIVSICIFMIIYVIFTMHRPCKHKWKHKENIILLNKYPRAIYQCKKCDELMHIKIKSYNELDDGLSSP